MEDIIQQDNHSIPEPKKNRFKTFMKILRRTFITIVVSILALIGLSFLLVHFYEDKIKAIAIEMVQNNTNAYIAIDDLNISFIRKFPNASVELEKAIIVQNVDGKMAKDTLARVGSFFLEFNWWDVLKDDIKLKTISLENGYISTVINKYGKNNFSIFKTSEIKDSTKNQQIVSLQQLALDDIYFTHIDERTNTHIDLKLRDFKISGGINKSDIDLNLKGEVFLNTLKDNQNTLLSHKQIEILLETHLNTETYFYKVNRGRFKMEDLDLLLQGSVDQKKETVDLNFGGDDLDLEVLLSLLPKEQKEVLKDYELKGNLEVNGFLKGSYAKSKVPEFKASVSSEDAYFKEVNSGEELKEVNFICNLSYHNNLDVDLKQFSVKLRNETIHGNLKYQDQFLKLALEGSANLEHLKDLLNSESINLMRGEAKIAFKLEGPLPDFTNIQPAHLEHLQKKGVLVFQNADYESLDEYISLRDFNAKITFHNNEVNVEYFKGLFNGGEVALNGKAEHLLAWLFFDDYNLLFDGKLEAKELVLDRYISDDGDGQADQENSRRDTLNWPQDIIANLHVQIDKFKADEVKMEQIKAYISMKPKEIRVSNIYTNAFGGNCSGNVSLVKENGFKVNMIADMKNISFETFLYQMEPFGLESIKAKNLEGSLNAKMDMSFDTDPTFVLDDHSVVIHFNFDAHEIKIKDWDILNESVAYMKEDGMTRKLIDVDYLAQQVLSIKVPLLTNRITLENGVVFIPQMNIKSSLLDIEVGGSHAIDGELNYHFNFRIKEILEKPKNDEYGYVVDDGTGIRIFLKVTGTIDDPVISFDKERKKEYQKAMRANEKDRLKDILHEEFGWFKKKKEKERKENEKTPTQFEIETDEEPNKEEDIKDTEETPWWKETKSDKTTEKTEFIIDENE